MQKIVPFLWFEKGAKEAADFYVSVFGKGAKVKDVSVMDGTPSGTIEIVTVELLGQELTIMAAGPFEKINAAISFVINCEDQKEIDYYWGKLSAVPEAEQCGWLKDKYGVSWQVVAPSTDKLFTDPDKEKAGRAMQAMLQMKKLDIAAIQKAFDGK
jgi:predicted 3-demethylubiquinone-9 3-methyltransferase (glyoxalase superfamily)